MFIAIDCGHCLSGADTGASAQGFREELITREVGNSLAEYLRGIGHTVEFINCDSANSVNSSLNYRVGKANSKNYDYVISIHMNAGKGRGIEIYVDGYSNPLATNIINEVVKLNFKSRGCKNGMELALVGNVDNKAMLIECCFIDSEDMQNFNSSKMAQSICKGIDSKYQIPSTTELYYKEEVKEVITFNEEYYLNNNLDVKEAVNKKYFASGYDHYIKNGKKEGRRPLPQVPPNFTSSGYLLCNKDVSDAVDKGYFASGLDHYLRNGWKENRKYIYNSAEVDEKLKKENEALKKKINNAQVALK